MNKFSPRDWYQKRGSEEMVEEEVAQEPVNEGAPTVNPGADRARNQQSDMTALLQQYGGNEGKATPDLADDFYRCVNCGADLEQKVNGVIKYIEANANTKIKLMEDFPPEHG